MTTRLAGSRTPAAESANMNASRMILGCWVGPMITRTTSSGISIPSSLSIGISAGMLRRWILKQAAVLRG